MKPKNEMDLSGKQKIVFEPMMTHPKRIFQLKRKGDDELKFATWRIFGGYGKRRSLAFGEAFVFIPNAALGAASQLTKFTVYKTDTDKDAGSHDFQVWVSSSPNPAAIGNLKITPHGNSILVTNQNISVFDSTRFFEITVNDAGVMRKLDPELKIKKKDVR